ncbi:MAG: hypothetical protein OXP66_07555 [Candidatus Tectomicrobia bacterium]|nr:hypothetical protein [Candidatus Tectomicrobia bacterium]
MESTRTDARRFGRPMHRDRRGHEGGGQLFIARRERDFMRGLLSDMGRGNDYLVFQPSTLFVKVLGNAVLRLNDALSGFRTQAVDHVLFLEGDDLNAHYADLDSRIGEVRDRVFKLTEYCNKGFDGQFREALEELQPAAAVTAQGPEAPVTDEGDTGNASDSTAGVVGARPAEEVDVFEVQRQRNIEQGILTDFGREQGCVAFQPCPFYGRFMSEIAYTLNDALRRMEGQTSYYVVDGNGEVLRQYYRELKNGMAALRRDLEGIIGFCRRKVA